MPTYSYACTECDHRFEVVQSFSDDSLTVCPECGGRLRKVFNAVGIVFKGGGFYRNDSRTGAGSSGSSGSNGSSDSGSSSDKAPSGDKAASTSSSSSTSSSGSSGSSSTSGASTGGSSGGSSSTPSS